MRLVRRLPPTVRDRVRLLGWVPREDLEALYAAADVMCFPSLLEGFGFPVVEAMAQGTPVVTSRGTSTEELVSGGAGLLVDPREPEEIAAALATRPRRPGARIAAGGGGTRAGRRLYLAAHGRARGGRICGVDATLTRGPGPSRAVRMNKCRIFVSFASSTRRSA